jgi:hypothetical protein
MACGVLNRSEAGRISGAQGISGHFISTHKICQAFCLPKLGEGLKNQWIAAF